MKKAVVQHRIDKMGRVVLPVQMRRMMGIDDKSLLNITSDGYKITLELADTCCAVCRRSREDLISDKYGYLCPDCIFRIGKLKGADDGAF